ncbi:MAG TPA: HIT family protein [Verrucomicrobiae bacterium]|jgi:histidine triad (HIT) family protein|nr:HIT family protein [Verrucomicrobiae bacterium]
MPTIFTKIINGEIPCHKIAESADYLAFLDLKPIHAGHTLVIPKKEVDYIFDMDDAALGGLVAFAKKVAHAVKKEISCKKIGVMVAGLEVPHAHIHLVPIHGVGDLNFAKAQPASQEDLAAVAEKIRRHWKG